MSFEIMETIQNEKWYLTNLQNSATMGKNQVGKENTP